MDIEFGSYRLRRRERYLDGPDGRLDISGRSFDLLDALLRHPNEPVSKAQLFDAVWPGLVVEENTLQAHVSNLRKILGSSIIVTVHGRGYKYAGPQPKPVGMKRQYQVLLQGPSHVRLPIAHQSSPFCLSQI